MVRDELVPFTLFAPSGRLYTVPPVSRTHAIPGGLAILFGKVACKRSSGRADDSNGRVIIG
jgi:hypothetical protein